MFGNAFLTWTWNLKRYTCFGNHSHCVIHRNVSQLVHFDEYVITVLRPKNSDKSIMYLKPRLVGYLGLTPNALETKSGKGGLAKGPLLKPAFGDFLIFFCTTTGFLRATFAFAVLWKVGATVLDGRTMYKDPCTRKSTKTWLGWPAKIALNLWRSRGWGEPRPGLLWLCWM